MGTFNAIAASDFTIEASDDGTNYFFLTGASGFTFSESPGAVNTQRTFAGSRNITSSADPGSITIELGGYVPISAAIAKIRSWESNSTTVTLRITSGPAQTVVSANASRLVAIDTSGLATFSGTDTNLNSNNEFRDQYGEGHVLKIGTVYYVVENASAATTSVITVSPAPASAVSASQYDCIEPQVRLTVNGKFNSVNNDSVSEGGGLSNSITLSLNSKPGNWVRV